MPSKFLSPTRKNLRSSIRDGVLFNLMVGMGETYLPAFVLALGFNQLAAGFIATLPVLFGAFLQLITPYAVSLLKSYKRWVVINAILQGLMFLPLAYAAYEQAIPLPILFLIVAIYWSAGMATGPAWNAWIHTLVPKKVRVGFFSVRTRIAQAGTVLGLVAGGILLEGARASQQVFLGFFTVFSVCFLLRMGSSYQLSRQTEEKDIARQLEKISIPKALEKISSKNYGKILFYLFALQFGVHFSTSYFTPFMLAQLNLSYFWFMVITASGLGARVVFLPLIRSKMKNVRLDSLLFYAGLGIAPMPAMWLVSDSIAYLICLQIFGGFAWACHELCFFLILFEEIPQKEQTSILSAFNLFQTVAMILGASCGALMLSHFGQSYFAYQAVFVVSSVLRLSSLFFFPSVFQHTRSAGGWLVMRSVAIRPSIGLIERPIIASIQLVNKAQGKIRKGVKEISRF